MKIPDRSVKASTVVPQSAELVKTLVEKGYAYWHLHSGAKNAYFDPLKSEGFGKLARLDMGEWPKKKRRFHKDTYPGTPWNRGDFILWHGCKKEGSACWDTEIGKGRPAWNIQDAAIVTKHLGFTIDLACGRIDNLVRHHDYTLAVAEGVSGKKLANYWFYGAHLFVDGKKMSKSKGNVYYPEDLMARGCGNDHARFFLIYAHYRKKLNFTFERLTETSRRLDAFKGMVQNLPETKSVDPSEKGNQLASEVVSGFEQNMNDDLNVKGAFDELYETVSNLHELKKERKLSTEAANATESGLHRIDSVLRVIF